MYRVTYVEGQWAKSVTVSEEQGEALLAGTVAFIEYAEGKHLSVGAVVRVEKV